MKKLLALLIGGLLASGAYSQADPATPAVSAQPAALAAPAAKASKARNHHAKAPAKHKVAKKKSHKQRKAA
jgi:hypothetical protein